MSFPLLGRLHRKASDCRYKDLSILLKSGIPLVDALEIARPAMGNRILEDGIKEATKLVGEDLTSRRPCGRRRLSSAGGAAGAGR
jgi:type II secretory pathway component PulF